MTCIKSLFLFRLKYFGDNTYEIDGFTTSIKATSEDIESLSTSNSSKRNHFFQKSKFGFFVLGGQPPLNLVNANYIFTQIAKLFCLMFHHEQTERSVKNESKKKENFLFFFKEIFILFKRRYYLEKIYGWLERSM
jgi:hypothetical protein